MFIINSVNRKIIGIFPIFLIIAFGLLQCEKSLTESGNDELEWNKKIAVAVVHSHAVMLSQILKDIDNETERIEIIRTAIDSVRFYDDSSGYFYVYNYDCVNIAHAIQKDLLDSNLYNHQDTHGKYVIRELAAAALAGGGFVEFYWVKPGATGEKCKLGYVEPIKNTEYFIGTGVYME